MKNYKKIILSAITLISLSSASIKAVNTTEPSSVPSSIPYSLPQIKAFESRIIEIKSMDKSKLKATEKKALRKELRTMKKAITNNGVYISVGSLIIIVLLLVLLL